MGFKRNLQINQNDYASVDIAAWSFTKRKVKQMSVILHAACPYTSEDYSSVSRLPLSLGLYPDNTPVVDLEDAWNHAQGEFKAIEIHALSIPEKKQYGIYYHFPILQAPFSPALMCCQIHLVLQQFLKLQQCLQSY